jgi:dimethylargininase
MPLTRRRPPRMFTHALIRLPGANYADGLTRADLGRPSLREALRQHADYCAALRECGLSLIELPADERFPDGCFVEDTALLFPEGALLTRPGAASREGEVEAIRSALFAHYPRPDSILAPGTLDGGDICVADRTVFIGVSGRTNEAGAGQLRDWLVPRGYAGRIVDIRGMDSILHLKSGLAWLGEGRVLLIDELAEHPAFADFQRVRVDAAESYAANAVRINDRVLIAEGYPRLRAGLQALGYRPLELAMGEFAKMDGGLSCLSLRF